MFGYINGQPTSQSYFGTVNKTFAMDDVQCLGNEATILACPHNSEDNCGGHEGAGVICRGIFYSNQLKEISHTPKESLEVLTQRKC